MPKQEDYYSMYFSNKTHKEIIAERDEAIKQIRIENEIKLRNEEFERKDKEFERKKFLQEKQLKRQSIVGKFIINENADNRLYYFRFIFRGKKYYKLGITSQTLKNRYGKDYDKIDRVLYDSKIDGAIKIEKQLKEKFKDDIFPLKYFNDSGHTEIFDSDILNLDIEQ